jgi:hypothetical protein
MELRKAYKDMRLAIKKMEEAAQLRMKERRVEWGKTNRVKKENEE